MALFEEITLTDSIEIRTSPEKVFDFLVHLVDDKSYRIWHPEDHIAFRWLKGKPWEEGSEVYAEEYIHGKVHKLKFIVTKVVPGKEIEYVPSSRLLRRFFPKNQKKCHAFLALQGLIGLVGLSEPLRKTNSITGYQGSRNT